MVSHEGPALIATTSLADTVICVRGESLLGPTQKPQGSVNANTTEEMLSCSHGFFFVDHQPKPTTFGGYLSTEIT